jgi:FkbM family methyltransferase
MLQDFIRNSVVNLFGLIARLGLHRSPFLNRLFLASYTIYKQYVEVGPIDRLREFVPSGSLVIDVGANVGFFSRRFAEWVGDDGRVIAIEPEDHNYASLVSALKRDDLLQRVQALKAVAADAPGMMLLEINPLHPADHKLSRNGTGIQVKAVTLDELVKQNSPLRPHLVKIDVQGAEMLVLRGAAGILESCGPALFVELHEEGLNKFGTSVSAILEYLSNHDYAGYWLKRSGAHAKASDAEIHARVSQSGYVDVLFLKNN